jgi:hypothetical protein
MTCLRVELQPDEVAAVGYLLWRRRSPLFLSNRPFPVDFAVTIFRRNPRDQFF